MTEARPVILFYHRSMEALAQRVASHKDYQGRIKLGRIMWNTFADGFPNIKVHDEDCSSLEHHDAAFLASMREPAEIFEQLAILYALPRMRARHFRVFVPYFSTGTMERVDAYGEVATAATMARILSAIPSCPTGPSTVVVYDIHALQEQFYFADTVLVQLKSAVHLLRQKLASLPDKEKVSIAFPDDGAAKRFKRLVGAYPHVVCIKVRDGDARKVVVKEGEVAGRHCVILDDLVQTGGTLIECAKALKVSAAPCHADPHGPPLGPRCAHAGDQTRCSPQPRRVTPRRTQEAGATTASCFVTHGVFPNQSWKRFVGTAEKPTPFHKVWITDTVPNSAAAVEGQEPFEVLSIAPLIGNLITGDPPLEG